MQERFAIGNQSLYSEYKGIKAMPEGASSVETRKSLETHVEGKVGTSTKKEVHGREQRENQKRELLKKLEGEKRSTSHKRQKATEQLEPPKPKVAQVVEGKPIIPTKENPVIVESYPHFENSSREQVVETLKAQNVRTEVPNEEDWKRMGALGRRRWVERNGIENVVELPDKSTVFEDEKTGSRVSIENDGRVIVLMKEPKVLEEDTFNDLLARAGSNIRVSYSGLVDAKDQQRVKDLLKEYGVLIIPEMAGGAVVYTDTNTVVDSRELYRRLDRLDNDELTMGTADFLASGRNLDRQEILERFRSEGVRDPDPDTVRWDALREFHVEDALIRLRGLESMERILGTDNFNAVGLNENRQEVYDKLEEYWGADEVLRRLMEIDPSGPLTVIQSDERSALQKALEYQLSLVRSMGAAQRNGYMFVNNLAKAIETQQIISGASGQLTRLDSFFPPATRQEIFDIRKNWDQHFGSIRRSLQPEVEAQLFSRFENRVKTLETHLQYGNIRSLTEFERRLYEEAIQGRGLPGSEGIHEWRAAQIFEGYESRIERERLLGIPDSWQDSLRNVNNNLLFIESVEFTPEELLSARNRLVGISEALSQRARTLRDPDEIAQAESMLREVNEVKDSVLAFYEVRIAMETSAMDPEKILPHFESLTWKDNTFLVYFRRFYRDHLGREFEDRNGTFNMLDRGMQVIFARLRQEKQTMNLVEGLSIVDIATPFAAGDARFSQIERLLGRTLAGDERNRLEELRSDFNDRIINYRRGLGAGTAAGDINTFWSSPFAAKDIVGQWYRENTILGAHGYRAGDNEHQYLDQRKEDLRGELEELLRNNGVSQALIDEYRDQGLFTQIVNNSYSVATVLGAFSDYDGIRLWDRKSVWFKDRSRGNVPRLGAFVYNTATSMFTGRMVDHYGEFLTDEVRGRPRDVNHEFTKFMLGKKRGILGNNRLLVKFTADILDDTRNFNKEFKDRLVVDGSGRSFRNLLTDKIVNIEGVERLKIGERRDVDESGRPLGDYSIVGGELYDNIWARGAAIEELIEGGEVSFENLEFSKLFENEKTNIIRYNMQDWWGDRDGQKKYFASGAMQEYLKNPGTRLFFQMNREIFYSKREIRIQPWMKLVIPAHQEIGKHWQEWWKLPYDMPHAETKRVIDEAVRLNMLDYRYRDVLENKLLGWGPFSGNFLFGRVKALRYTMELADRNAREFGKRDWELLFLWPLQFFKEAGQQAFAQLAGK